MSRYDDFDNYGYADFQAEMARDAEYARLDEAENRADVNDLPTETLKMLERVRALDPALADEMGHKLAVQQFLAQESAAEELRRAHNIAEARARVDRAEEYIGEVYRKHADDPDWGEDEVNAAVADKCRAEDELLLARDPDAYAEQVYFYGKRNGIIGG